MFCMTTAGIRRYTGVERETPCSAREVRIDNGKVMKLRKRRRQRRLQIFKKKLVFKDWEINVKQWIDWFKSC